MNNDNKFQKRAEMMKTLFEAQIPHVVIMDVMGLSLSTVIADRKKVEKKFSIQLPIPKRKEELYSEMLVRYAEVQVQSRRKDPLLYKVAEKILDSEKISTAIRSMCLLWENIRTPQHTEFSEEFEPYVALIREIFGNNFFSQPNEAFMKRMEHELWCAIIYKRLDISDIRTDAEFIMLIASYFASKHREDITSLSLNEQNIIANVHKALDTLSDKNKMFIQKLFGLNGEKNSLDEMGEKFELTRQRINQLKKQCLRIIGNYRYPFLLKNIQSQKMISFLEEDNKRLREEIEIRNEKKNTFLILKNEKIFLLTKDLFEFDLSVRTLNCLKAADLQYPYQVYKHWESLPKFRNMGKKTLQELRDFFAEIGINPEKRDSGIIELCEEYINQ